MDSRSQDHDFDRRVRAGRLAKDEYFRRSPRSPLPPDQQPDFIGLAYFAPDISYRLEGLRLTPLSHPETLPFAIDTSDHRPRTARRLGRLEFTLGGRDLALTAYRVGEGEPESPSLFIPFRDETNGRETYGAGRYLDVTPESDRTYVIDFNDAYNPYCAYSKAYSCALPPDENRLPVAIEAGERLGAVFRSDRGQ
jgi:uncharacterized protein (DUF1684 family)